MYVLLLIKLQPKNSRFSILFRLFFKRENAKQNFIEQNQLSMENNPTVATFYYGRVFFIETSYHKTNHKQDFWETFVTGKSIVLHFLLGFVWPRALLPLYSFWLQKKNLHTLILNYKFLAEKNSIRADLRICGFCMLDGVLVEYSGYTRGRLGASG